MNKVNILKNVALVVGVFCATALSHEAGAATATADLNVTASITATCTIATTPLDFGAYDPVVTNLSAPLDGTGSVTTTCTTGTSPVITLGQGANAGTGSTAAAPVRRMANGAAMMSYGLFQAVDHAATWGDTAGTAPAAGTGDGAAHAVTVFGRVAGAQNLPTGSYADVVVATVTF